MRTVNSAVRPLWPGILFLAVLMVVGCVPIRSGVSWANLSLVGDAQNILVAYNDYMVLVDSATGVPVQLLDSQGQGRVDERGNPRPWEVRGGDTDSKFFAAPIFLDDGNLLVADYNSRLLTVNFAAARIDNPIPITIPGRVIADMVVDDSAIYVPLSDHDVVALDFNTYEVLWTATTERGVWSSPVVVDDVVYFAAMDHYFYAVEAATGRVLWRQDMGGAVAASPVYHDGRFYVGTFSREILEVSRDGQILTRFKTQDWVWSTPVVRDDVLYVTDLSGHVYALSVDGLTEIWRRRAASEGIRARPVVTDDYVIVAARNGTIFWLNRTTGQPVILDDSPLERSVDAEVLSDMLLIEWGGAGDRQDLLIVSTVSNSRVLVAFTLHDGARRWVYQR